MRLVLATRKKKSHHHHNHAKQEKLLVVFFGLLLFALSGAATASTTTISAADTTCGDGHDPHNVEDNNENGMNSCICGNGDRSWSQPEVWKKAETARWMVHTIDWGVLTTLSSRSMIGSSSSSESTTSDATAVPFGNVYSFIDGSCSNATGIPYFYGSYMDQSFQDMLVNSAASLTLSEASLVHNECDDNTNNKSSVLNLACTIVPGSRHRQRSLSHHTNNKKKHGIGGDPENPVCARLTLTGRLEPLDATTDLYARIQAAFFQRHPSMANWPPNHQWAIVQLVVHDVWLIDYFGGATVLAPHDFFDPANVPQSHGGTQ